MTDKFPNQFKPNILIRELKESPRVNFELAGRIMAITACYITLRDGSGELKISYDHEKVTHLKPGDIIWVACQSVADDCARVLNLELLVNATRTLPTVVDFNGADITHGKRELTRKRYVELLLNDDLRTRLKQRSQIIVFIRKYLANKGFMEVETPILTFNKPSPESFRTLYNHYKQEVGLRQNSEVALKQCVIGGFTKVFELGRNFNMTKLPWERTFLILYEAYTTPSDLSKMVGEMLQACAQEIVINAPEFLGHSPHRPWQGCKYEIDDLTGAYDPDNPTDFFIGVEYGLPPTTGIALDIDYLVQKLTRSKHIEDIIWFPYNKETRSVG